MFLLEIQNSSWRSPDARRLCDSARLFFLQLPWCGGTSGFTNSEPTVKLAAYLSKNWLETTHIDQQLDLLRIDLARTGSTEYEVIDPHVFEKLITVYRYREQTAYRDASGMRHLWAIGCELAQGTRTKLGGVANVIRHWVGVVVDVPNSVILYSDSLGGSHAQLKAAIEWWVQFHTGKSYTHESLPITQQLDSYNCPILAVNAVCHHLLPQSSQLLSSQPLAIIEERLTIFKRICERDAEMVSKRLSFYGHYLHRHRLIAHILGDPRRSRSDV